ncbi:hypothetical protein [Roseivirga sp. E12]|uniref:hypothetical protein n=1 Tax=Roseivirga sp. E12 TaxID=2819237 RepID=UPI001ABC5CE3|nr:hypothetical protein [Roseivirga sp. E12]MBO3700139.1 hypothetical protein [Roseivirga sp. E12]
MRLNRLLKSRNLKVYTMELVIVILGISIAYQLNIINENRINNKLELNILKNLDKEIQINIAEFKSLEAYRKRITKDSDHFLYLIKNNSVSLDTANKYVFRLVQTSTPDLQQQATTSYLSSNYGSSNIELKNELLALQTYFQELLDLSEGYKDRKQQDYMGHLRTSVDFLERKVIDLGSIRSIEFKNIVWNMATDEYELNRLYDQASAQLVKVDSLITNIISEHN